MSKKLGKYEITERLGRGGMAEVYRAYHAALDRFVAVKLLHPFLADDPEFKQRFEREAQNVARLRHPNIVQVFDFDFDESGESYYMVMEYVTGSTLKDVMQELHDAGRKLEISRAIEIARDSAKALAYAHQRQMLHRDVKPANLMIEEDGRLVLTDFGIAKIVTGIQTTQSGGMIGTPAYMSPEQGLGETGDERSDLYSLGAILYEMLTGQLPFDADTPLAVILKHLNDPLIPPRQLNSEIPEWLDQVVVKLLAKDPAERFQTADELISALEAGQIGMMLGNIVAADQPSRPMALRQTSIPMPTEPVSPFKNQPSGFSPSTLLIPTLIVVGFLVVIGLILGQGGTGPLAGLFPDDATEEIAVVPTATTTELPTATDTDVPTPTDTVIPSDTPTPTDSPSPTPSDTPSPTASDTPTDTNTPRPTFTYTPSSTSTHTPDFTATTTAITATAQAQIDFFATQRAITPTVDVQRVLEECDLAYSVVSPEGLSIPPAVNEIRSSRLIRNGQKFTIEVTVLNTSTCDWPAGLVFLSFIEAAELNVSTLDENCASAERIFTNINFTSPQIQNIRLNETVEQGETYTFTFEGQASPRFGCYFSAWELRIPDYDIFIGDPFIIGFTVFGGQ